MKVIIFHGWGSTSKDNWFPWLKKELESKFKVTTPDLPNSQFPNQTEWINTALKLTDYDNNTILVGHSLGSVLILRLLEKIKVKSAYLVSAFDEHLGIPDIMDFFLDDFDYDTIRKNAKITMLNSDNDPYIPLDIAKKLANNLKCELKVYKNKEHLSSGTNNFKFPELRDMINEAYKKN